MPPKKVTQTKTSVSDEVFTDEDGKNHLIECSGPGQDGNGCVAWVPVWLPTRLPKNFAERPFLCGYCAFTEVEKLRKEAHGYSKGEKTRLSNLFLSDANEQYGRREEVRIFGVEDQTGEDFYQQVVDVVKGTGFEICKSDISVCHRLPAKGQSGKPIIVKFVRRKTKLALMKKESGLRHQSGRPIFINDDITRLRARLLKSLKEKPDVKAANMINEKIIVYQTNNDKVVFHTLHELYKWDPSLVMPVCTDKLSFQ